MKEKLNHIISISKIVIVAFVLVLFILASHRPVLALQPMVATGNDYSVILKSDGTVLAFGRNDFGQCNISSWTDIVQVAAGFHTVGLKSDGTVVAVGRNNYGQLDVSSWTDIKQIAAGWDHTVGLKSEGTVVAVGDNLHGQLNISSWTDIVQVAAGNAHTVGLKSNGTAVAVGLNNVGQLDVSIWTGIVQVVAGCFHTVGVKSDGSVVAVGLDYGGQLNVSSWTDIVQVAAACENTVGLKSDGTLVAVGANRFGECDVSSWNDIFQVVNTSSYHTVGLKSNNKVVAVGKNNYGECNFFTDFPLDYWAVEAIYQIFKAGITKGCSAIPLMYCPDNTVTRTQMAVFLGRAIHGSNFTPDEAIGIFTDVPVTYWAADWIEQFYNDGITSGCSTNPFRYCPYNPVTRAQMAIFLLRAKYGSSYKPPPATGIFSDVPVTYWAANWIELLYKAGITTGCATGPLRYCPENSVTRAQMAVFMMRTFGL